MVSGHLDREKKSTNSNSPTKWFFWNHSIGFPSICLDCPWVSWDSFGSSRTKLKPQVVFFNQLTSWFLWTASWSHGFFEPPLEVMVSLKAFVAVLFEGILKQTLTNSLRLVLSFNCQKFQIDFYEISLTYVYKNHILIYVFFRIWIPSMSCYPCHNANDRFPQRPVTAHFTPGREARCGRCHSDGRLSHSKRDKLRNFNE